MQISNFSFNIRSVIFLDFYFVFFSTYWPRGVMGKPAGHKLACQFQAFSVWVYRQNKSKALTNLPVARE